MTEPAEDALVARLRAAGCVFAEDEALVLREEAGDDVERLDALLAERVAGRPLEYVLGWAEFAGLRVHVRDGVFVPRNRSRLLVDLACRLAPPGGVLLDLCCGAGALAMAAGTRRRDLTLVAADLDPDATACARMNLPGAEVHTGDLFEPLPARWRGAVDVLVVNAPYVPTGEIALMPPEARDHEHRMALDGGADGLDVHRRVARDATTWLAPGGALTIEVAEHQAATACALMTGAGLDARTFHDEERGATAVVATR